VHYDYKFNGADRALTRLGIVMRNELFAQQVKFSDIGEKVCTLQARLNAIILIRVIDRPWLYVRVHQVLKYRVQKRKRKNNNTRLNHPSAVESADVENRCFAGQSEEMLL
jgi:hypothetical protein